MLKYTLYAWPEPTFYSWKGKPTAANFPLNAEMFDVSEENLKEQLSDWFDCTPDEIFLSQSKVDGTSVMDDHECQEPVFGLHFWDVQYPTGIGSYLVVLNHLEEDL